LLSDYCCCYTVVAVAADSTRRSAINCRPSSPWPPSSPAPVSPALALLFAPSTEHPGLGSTVARHCCRRRRCLPSSSLLAVASPLSRSAGFWELGFGGDGEGRRGRQRRGESQGGRAGSRERTPPFCVICCFVFFFLLFLFY